jgi:hypothetical protein
VKKEGQMPANTNSTDRIYTEEEVLAFTEEEVRAFTDSLFKEAVREIGATLPDNAEYFSDSSYDGLMGDIDMLATVTALNYDQGTPETLAHFLFSTEEGEQATYGWPLNRYIGSNATSLPMLATYEDHLFEQMV